MSGKPWPWHCPASRMVLASGAARADWLAERTKGIGGSDVPVLLGASPYGSPFEVWLSKVQPAAVEDTPNAAMVRGSRLEPVLAQWFSDDTDLAVRNTGLHARRDRDHHRVNPDRLVEGDGLLELKTHSPFAGEAAEWDTGYARRAWLQGQWGLWVTGRSVLWLAALVGVAWHIRGPLPRDDDAIAAMVEAVDRFWADHVLTRTPPPVDWSTATDDELDARWPAPEPDTVTDIGGADAEMLGFTVEQLRDVQADLTLRGSELRQLEKVRDSLRTRLRAAAAGREYLSLAGRPVARWATTTRTGQPLAGRIDTAALRAALPDIAAEYTRPAAPRFTLLED